MTGCCLLPIATFSPQSSPISLCCLNTNNPYLRSVESPEPLAKRPRVEDREMPHTPIRTQVAPPQSECTLCISTLSSSCAPSSTDTPPRLRRRELTPTMQGALQPFTQYMSDLAEGKFDKYFDPTQLEPWDTHLELPSGPLLLLHDLGNYPDDARLTGIFKSETVFVSL